MRDALKMRKINDILQFWRALALLPIYHQVGEKQPRCEDAEDATLTKAVVSIIVES
jgi:hypothetical protein